GRIPHAMSIRVDHHVDKISISEGRCRAAIGFLVEFPRRRPKFPKQAAELVAVLRETVATALGVEVVLIPEAPLLHGTGRLLGSRYVLNLIAGAAHEPAHPLRPHRSDDAGCARTPIEAGQYRFSNLQSVKKVKQILSNGRLLSRARRVRRQEARRTIAAEVRNDRAQA